MMCAVGLDGCDCHGSEELMAAFRSAMPRRKYVFMWHPHLEVLDGVYGATLWAASRNYLLVTSRNQQTCWCWVALNI